MSASAELQKVIVDRLRDQVGVVDERVYDHVPRDRTFPYINIGAMDFNEDDAECITGRVATVQVDIWSRYPGGKKEAHEITDAAKKALHLFDGQMPFDALVEMRVTFGQVIDDPDGITTHGILQVQAIIEESE